ncbi:MAG: hypothetical protein LBG93_04755 [Treponema sp.]|jgi:hypothetical protein|nr:hypothetical protein [Treponema sp.]
MTANFNALVLRWKTAFLKGILLFTVGTAISAQETLLEELPVLKDQAVVMRIVSRIVEQNEQVVWNSENSRVTLPGRPIGLKLVGTNMVVTVQFTPVLQPNDRHILVAQGQIWINIPGEGMRYHTMIQTIPLVFDQEVLFFPLGSMESRDEAFIEIQLVVRPYTETFVGRGHGREGSPPAQAQADRGDTTPRRWGGIGSP